MKPARVFTARIQNAGGGGAFVEVPFDVERAFGSKRPKITALIEEVPYRGTLTRMGGRRHMLIILKSIRERIGKTFGDTVRISVALDTKPRIVRVPADLRKELSANAKAKAFFGQLSHTHRKEYVTWVEAARRPETRARRIKKTITMLLAGRRGV
jgi:hypothetical protein